MFGFRGWHDGDLDHIVVDDLDALIASAIAYEREAAKEARRAQ